MSDNLSRKDIKRILNKSRCIKGYTPGDILEWYNNDQLHKPVFQRPGVWKIRCDGKEGVPSMEKYIWYCFENRDSGKLIFMGQDSSTGDKQLIDGANRTNAILNFVVN